MTRSLAVFALASMTFAVSAGESSSSLELESFASGFAAPLQVAQPPDDSGRVFVVDQIGQVWEVSPGGEVAATPFLDLSDRIVELEPRYDERGLLGLDFHPDFASNGRFYVYYSVPLSDDAPEEWDHTSRISEFTVDSEGDQADPNSERVVLEVDQPYHNHNAGQIAFGPDGYLYVPLGDGGNGGDIDAPDDDRGRPEIGWAQTTDSLLGSILRIDIDPAGDGPYAIPADNPFLDDDEVEDEVYAYGFRNPYGFSFDLDNGDMYVTDAGQALYEEVSRVEPGGNYGWNIREGTHCFNTEDFLQPPETCSATGYLDEPLIDPVIEYQRGPDAGSVIVPGVMARDPDLPSLEGRFLFGDYGSIRFLPTGVLYLASPTDGLGDIERLEVGGGASSSGQLERFLLGIDQDQAGGIYVLTTRVGGPVGETGEVFRVSGAVGSGPSLWLMVAVGAGVVAALAAGLFIARARVGGRGSG